MTPHAVWFIALAAVAVLLALPAAVGGGHEGLAMEARFVFAQEGVTLDGEPVESGTSISGQDQDGRSLFNLQYSWTSTSLVLRVPYRDTDATQTFIVTGVTFFLGEDAWSDYFMVQPNGVSFLDELAFYTGGPPAMAWVSPGWSPLTLPDGIEGHVSEIFGAAPPSITLWSPAEEFFWDFFHPATGQGTDFSTAGRTIYTHNTGEEEEVPLGSTAPTPPPPPPDPAAVPVISTRGHFEDIAFTGPRLTSGHTTTDYSFDFSSIGCPEELVIYVHGFENTAPVAQENFDTARASLRFRNYDHPVVGFSWDSNQGKLDFDDAKNIATSNGTKLAQFIMDYQSMCPDTKIRLIGHSMGARVILNALQVLDGSAAWGATGAEIRSVHVMGAAVDNGEVDRSVFGTFIENQVGEFHNLWNPEDDVLSGWYPFEEGDSALGESGAEFMPGGRPSNYSEQNVETEISTDTDGNGWADEFNQGDNHSGYAGVVNSEGKLTSDGAMDVVVNHWTAQESN